MSVDLVEKLKITHLSVLARSILGTDEPDQILELINRVALKQFAFREPVCIGFELSVGAVFVLRDVDGREGLLKVMSPDVSLAEALARVSFQRYLVENGFPCPSPRATPIEVEGLVIVFEEYLDTGRPASGHSVVDRKLMAQTLAWLLELSRRYPEIDDFPTDPFVFNASNLWPKPHNVLFDFSLKTLNSRWIDDVAAAVKIAPGSYQSSSVIGHLDWSAKHCRIEQDQLVAVFDWDSTAFVPETRILGSALASFTYREGTLEKLTPDVGEIVGFLIDYEAASQRVFTEGEISEISASLVFAAAYTARCEDSIDDGSSRANHQARDFLKLLAEVDLDSVLNRR